MTSPFNKSGDAIDLLGETAQYQKQGDISEELIARESKAASLILGTLSNDDRNDALRHIHESLLSAKDEILEANEKDMMAARESSIAPSLLKRLELTHAKFDSMLQGVLDIAALSDPLGKVTYAMKLDEGLELERVSCALGVLLVIFEARPEVVVNIAALALKSGNAAILKGGKESTRTALLLHKFISIALSRTEIPPKAITVVTTRDEVSNLLRLHKHIDLVIPRGSNALVSSIQEGTKIPVMGHADGICMTYVHSDADLNVARRIVKDGKCDYVAACNSIETLLFHESLLKDGGKGIKEVVAGLLEANVELRCTDDVLAVLGKGKKIVMAKEGDEETEFLDYIIYVTSVTSLEAAIRHINTHSSHHTDVIITRSADVAHKFQKSVDSAGVFWNASSRFADGFRYGFGAEVGISTGRLHARGPVGLEGLTSYKYILHGEGHIVGEYGEKGGKSFLHERREVGRGW